MEAVAERAENKAAASAAAAAAAMAKAVPIKAIGLRRKAVAPDLLARLADADTAPDVRTHAHPCLYVSISVCLCMCVYVCVCALV
jgi:hypothetical protein